jgi:hypothetical protein
MSSLCSLPKDVFIYLAWKYLNKADRVALMRTSRLCYAVVWRARQEYALVSVSRSILPELQPCKRLAVYNMPILCSIHPTNLRRLQLYTLQMRPGDRLDLPLLEDMAIESTIQIARNAVISLPHLRKLIIRQSKQGFCLCALLGAVAETLEHLQVTTMREVRHFYGISEFWLKTPFPRLRHLMMQCFLPSHCAIAQNMPALEVTNCITVGSDIESLLLVELAKQYPHLCMLRSKIAQNNAIAEALFFLSAWYPNLIPLIRRYLAMVPREYLGGQELFYSTMFQPLSVHLLHGVMPLQNMTREIMIHKLMSRQREYEYLTLITTEEEQQRKNNKKKN